MKNFGRKMRALNDKQLAGTLTNHVGALNFLMNLAHRQRRQSRYLLVWVGVVTIAVIWGLLR